MYLKTVQFNQNCFLFPETPGERGPTTSTTDLDVQVSNSHLYFNIVNLLTDLNIIYSDWNNVGMLYSFYPVSQ